MKLLVVIVSYRVTDLTVDCLRSLEPHRDEVPGTRVAVCENGTGPEAVDQLRQAIEENGWGGWVDLTSIYPNRGFTGGNNVVIRDALAAADPPQYVLLLNADTLVEADSLKALVTFMDDHPQAGIAGSLLLSADRKPQASPFRFPGIASELDRGMRLEMVSRLLRRWNVHLPQGHQPSRAGWVSGASMILRRTMLDQVGLLDEGLFTYFDDCDICLRAARSGWETWFVPASRVIHLEGASTGVKSKRVARRPSYWYQARHRYFTKSHGPFYAALADAAFILGYSTWRLRRWIQRKPDTDPAHMLLDSIRHSVFWAGPRVREVENPALKQQGVGVPEPEPA